MELPIQPSSDELTAVQTEITRHANRATAAWPIACRWLCIDIVKSFLRIPRVRSYGKSAYIRHRYRPVVFPILITNEFLYLCLAFNVIT
jgi:hypothetical protein